ncbi:Fc.00g035010.m01.CDS01 [Cosmosporella sp. VM-42]
MAPSTRGQHLIGQRWNPWTAVTATILMLVVSNLSIPVSAAVTATTPHLRPRAPIADGVELRVLPIGDSITFGSQSSYDNGYRKSLYDDLVARDNEVHFVGNLSDGNFAEPDHEGHRKFRINEIAAASLKGIYAAPNIVLLHAGTNDMKDDIDTTGAPERLEKLIDLIYSKSPNAAVFVCQLIPADPERYPYTVPRITKFNAAIPGLVASFVKAGKNVTMVSMNKAVSVSDLADGLHPNDAGYEKMANAYYDAIEEADAKHWIFKPGKASTPPTVTNPSSCRSTPSWYNVGQIADGAKVASSDGDFRPAWVLSGFIAEGACPRAQLHFMDLDGDGLKDYACVDPDTGATKVHLNIPDSEGKSSGNWKPLGTIATPSADRNGTWVMFADLNGDGRDDYIYVDPENGDVYAWINRLEQDGVWQWQGIGKIAGGVGARYDNLQMVDLDGDGRDDFCIVDKTTGAVTAWLNTGAASVPDYHKLGVIATGASASKGDTIRLGDLTGEGRADYMVISSGGKVTALVNRLQETSMAPRWLPAFTLADGPDGTKQDQVRLVDMTGDGKIDYLLIDEKTGKVTLWENAGLGGKYQPGEGVILCDLDGDGTSDYFWLDDDGSGWGYLNTGKGTNVWYGLGKIVAGVGHSRDQIRMGVLTKSHRADYIVIDDDTGRAEWWQNLGEEWNYSWASRGVAATGPKNTIENTYGWKFKGKNVRFADLDGDGLADYLYVNDQGAVVYWKNLGTASATSTPTWGIPHLVADGVGVLAQDVQFADTNGDGLLDYVVVGRISGMTRSWHNLGFRDDMSIRWNTPLSFADGVGSRGSAIRITEMTGDKRADYVSIDPDTGRLNLWHNRCWATSDPDPPTGIPDPEEPDAHLEAVVSFPDRTCTDDQKVIISKEAQYAIEIAVETSKNLQRGVYFDEFFDTESRAHEDFAANTARVYDNIAMLLSGTTRYKVKATCNAESLYCAKNNWYAHMNDRDTKVNFCKKLWGDTRLGTTENLLSTCKEKTPDLRDAQRTYAGLLIHEMTHTSFVMSFQAKTIDYAYGFTYCQQLARGLFDRECMRSQLKGNPPILCPDDDGKESTCAATKSPLNADTYSFVAAGVYFTAMCGKDIPLAKPVSKRAMSVRQESCPVDSDAIFWDGVNPIGAFWQIVQFGDSYAAGMGTGKTTTDKCRVGSNNYGKLLYGWMNDEDIEFVQKPCSGDTLEGLDGKIKSWTNTDRASIATLSIGGNDVGFSELVSNCIVTPFVNSGVRVTCSDAKKKAADYLSDTGDSGLRAKLKEAYLSILNKSGQEYFHLYVTGYAKFFNEATADCANTTFYWFQPRYHPYGPDPDDDLVYLTTDVRSELNDLVGQLNGVISGAVSDANEAYGSNQAHFVNVDSSFSDNHRWCENPNGEFHEPDESRDDTWFFLSAWKDVSIGAPGGAGAIDDYEAAEVAAIIAEGKISLPDPDTCHDSLGTDPDPYDYAMCQVSITIAEDPSGPEAVRYQNAVDAISSQDFNSEDIRWYAPTRQIKTFHPRSPGMVAFRDALIKAIEDAGQL